MNRLARQIAALRMQAQGNNDSNATSSQAPTNASNDTAATATAPAPATRPVPSSSSSRVAVAAPLTSRVTASTAGDPSTEVIMEALRKENETLRNRLVKMERDWRQEMRLNEIYREELIRHRRRVRIGHGSRFSYIMTKYLNMSCLEFLITAWNFCRQPHWRSGPIFTTYTPSQ